MAALASAPVFFFNGYGSGSKGTKKQLLGAQALALAPQSCYFFIKPLPLPKSMIIDKILSQGHRPPAQVLKSPPNDQNLCSKIKIHSILTKSLIIDKTVKIPNPRPSSLTQGPKSLIIVKIPNPGP